MYSFGMCTIISLINLSLFIFPLIEGYILDRHKGNLNGNYNILIIANLIASLLFCAMTFYMRFLDKNDRNILIKNIKELEEE